MRKAISNTAIAAITAALPLLSGCGRPGTGATTVPSVTVLPSEVETAGDGGPGVTPKNGGTPSGGTGKFTGRVVFKGTARKLSDLIAKGKSPKDKSVCAATSAIPDQSFLVGPNGGVANVFIYLKKAPKGWAKDDPAAMPADVFDQQGCVFEPHAKIFRAEQTIMVKSKDPISHNTHIYSTFNGEPNFSILPGDRVGVAWVYKKGEVEPVEVKCDIHVWMKAYHLPLNHPFGVVTDANGKFTIPDLPSGSYKFSVWHEAVDGGYLERRLPVTIKADETTNLDIPYK